MVIVVIEDFEFREKNLSYKNSYQRFVSNQKSVQTLCSTPFLYYFRVMDTDIAFRINDARMDLIFNERY